MPVGKPNWQVLAEGFPPTLVTNADETALEPNQTPSATGLDMSTETYLVKNTTAPTMNTRVLKSYSNIADGSGSTANYVLHYERLWRIDTAELVYGAPWQVGLYLPQGPGRIEVNEDTNAILKILPIGTGGLLAIKSTGAYIIPNANSKDGRFTRSGLIQEAKVSTATHVDELDGVVYFCNSDGLFSIDVNGQVNEVSFPVRGDVTAAVVTTDYKNKYIKVAHTTPFYYDVNTKRWFKYASDDSFVYETRRMQSVDRRGEPQPFAVDRVAFQYKWDAGTADDELVEVKFKTQVEDREWSAEEAVQASNSRGKHAFVEYVLPQPEMGKNFKLRVTDIPDELSILRILVYSDAQVPEARDS